VIACHVLVCDQSFAIAAVPDLARPVMALWSCRAFVFVRFNPIQRPNLVLLSVRLNADIACDFRAIFTALRRVC
jgi:hypothetical protein